MAHNGIYGQAYRCKQIEQYTNGIALPATPPTTDGAGTLTIPLNGVTYLPFVPQLEGGSTVNSVDWLLFSGVTIGTLGLNAEYIWLGIRVNVGFWILTAKGDALDATKYRILVYTNSSISLTGATLQFTSSQQFTFGIAIQPMLYDDGSNAFLEVNGTAQGSFATTNHPRTASDAWQLGSAGLNLAGISLVVKPWNWFTSTSLAEKPDITTFASIAVYGDPASAAVPVRNEFNQTGGTGVNPKADAVDDYDPAEDPPQVANGDTDYISDPGTPNTTFRQTIVMKPATLANFTHLVQCRAWRVNSGTKTITTASCIADKAAGVSRDINDSQGIEVTTYRYRSYGIQTDAQGALWSSQAQLDNLQIGVLSQIGAQAVAQLCTALMGECFGVVFASPSTGGGGVGAFV